MRKSYNLFILVICCSFIFSCGKKWTLENEEATNKGLAEWIEQMHRAAPGINWKNMDNNTRWQSYLYQNNSKTNGLYANGNLQANWYERGASNQAGRIVAADIDTINNVIFCASAGGVVWKGNLQGTGWLALNDQLNIPRIVSLEVIPLNTSTRVLVASRDGMVYYSDNQGQTWNKSTGLNSPESWGLISRMVAVNNIDETIYLLAQEWSGGAITALYRSTDKGQSFSKMQSYPEGTYGSYDRFDIWTSPFATNETFMINNKSIYKITGNTGNPVYQSTISSSATGTTMITGSFVNNTTQLYAYIEKEIYRSNNGGLTWSYASTINFSPFSRYSFGAAAKTNNCVYIGDINAHLSVDGGTTFNIVNEWWEYYSDVTNKLHADIPFFTSVINTGGSQIDLIGTDGGLFVSYNNLSSCTNISLNGLNAAQYYSVYTNRNNYNNIYAASQDQGYQRTVSSPQNSPSTPIDFDQIRGGDYGHIVSSNKGNSIWMAYPGFVDYYANTNNNGYTSEWNFNGINPYWMPPLLADPTLPNVCYLAGGVLNGSGSKIIKLTENAGNITASQLSFNFGNAGNISAMAISPLNNNYWYVLTSQGQFFASTDAGINWTQNNQFNGPGAHYLYGANIHPSKSDLGTVFICGSGYSNPPVYKTIDNGASFGALNTGLPNTMVYEIDGSITDDTLFAATEVGAYVYLASTNSWYNITGNDGPDQVLWSVEYLDEINTARFGSYGRGIWDFNMNITTNLTNANSRNISANLFPNPTKDFISISGNYNAINQIITFDLEGKKILEINNPDNNKINFSNISAGIYVIEIKTDIGTIRKKLIKE